MIQAAKSLITKKPTSECPQSNSCQFNGAFVSIQLCTCVFYKLDWIK